MANKTKKVKSTGRFGARYGRGIKLSVRKIEEKQKAKHICPVCGANRVKRKAPGIYFCRKCKAKFSGGAYIPVTMAGSIVKKMVSQKSFLPNLAELLQAKEGLENEEETSEAEEGKGHRKPRPHRTARTYVEKEPKAKKESEESEEDAQEKGD